VPNIKSAIKRVKVAERNKVRNRTWKTSVRTAKTEVVASSTGKNKETSQTALNKAYKVIDMAVSKGVLHKNAAARRKSSLAKLVNTSTAPSKKKK
jgi:small subunit ribosomal protein S20